MEDGCHSQEGEVGLAKDAKSHLLHGSSPIIQVLSFIFQTSFLYLHILVIQHIWTSSLCLQFFISKYLQIFPLLSNSPTTTLPHASIISTATVPKLCAEALLGATVKSQGVSGCFKYPRGSQRHLSETTGLR